jgi:hypothetical protein
MIKTSRVCVSAPDHCGQRGNRDPGNPTSTSPPLTIDDSDSEAEAERQLLRALPRALCNVPQVYAEIWPEDAIAEPNSYTQNVVGSS